MAAMVPIPYSLTVAGVALVCPGVGSRTCVLTVSVMATPLLEFRSSGEREHATGVLSRDGDRFTVRAGGVVVGIGKVAVQDAWSRGGPRQEARNAGHQRPI